MSELLEVHVIESPEVVITDAAEIQVTKITKAASVPKGKPLELPPCKVCNGKASGIHYGVNSCEACKGFFRRYLSRKEPYVCNSNNQCVITERPRGNCSACRMQKCLKLGMSKGAVRQGRYTLEERTKTIKAVQDLKDKEDSVMDITLDRGLQTCQLIPENLSLLSNSNLPVLNIQNCPGNNSEIQLQNTSSFVNNLETSLQNSTEHDFEMQTQQSVTFERSVSSSETHSYKTSMMSPLNNSLSCDSYRTSDEWNSPPSSSSSPSDGSPETKETEDDLDSKLQVVLQVFRKAYDQFSYPSRKLTEKQLQDKLTDALERHKIQSEVFGPMKQIPAEEYNEIFEATGLDIDGRHGRILKYKELWEDIITQYVGFAKSIPGFTSLSISDQSTILKAARFEFFLILEYKYIDPKREVMVVSTGEAFHLEELCFYLPIPMMKRWFEFSSKIKDLNLSQDEMLIVMAVSLTFRDRAKLDNPDSVEKMQLEMAKYLRHLLKQRHGDKECLVFAKIIDMFIGIRELNNEYLTEFKKMCQDRVLVRTLPEMLEFLFDDT